MPPSLHPLSNQEEWDSRASRLRDHLEESRPTIYKNLLGPLGTPISPLRTVLTSAIVVICSLTQQHVFFLLLLTFKALKGQVCRAHFHGSLSILNIEEI